MSFFISDALAQSAGGQSGGFDFTAILPLIIMFGIFYFLLIRPQQKKSQGTQKPGRSLEKSHSHQLQNEPGGGSDQCLPVASAKLRLRPAPGFNRGGYGR